MGIKDREMKKKALIETMCFFDLFDIPLTKEEACDFSLYKKLSINELQDFIDHEEFVIETDNHIHFRNRSLNLKVRKDKEIRAQKLIRKAKRIAKWMQMLPFIRTVALCNSLSFYSAEKDSDIDLFIITEKARLFTARLWALIFTQIIGVRRHKKHISGRLCLSFMISKDEMNLESIKNEKDIYLIFWLRLMRPLFGQKTYREFMSKNDWIHEHFDYEIDQQKHLINKSAKLNKIQRILEWPAKGKFGDLLEKVLGYWQKKRANKKRLKLDDPSGVIVNNHMLKFHNIDMRKKFQQLWALRFNQFQQYLTSSSSPSVDDFSSEYQSRSHQSRILYESHSQDSAYKKSEKHSPDSQKV